MAKIKKSDVKNILKGAVKGTKFVHPIGTILGAAKAAVDTFSYFNDAIKEYEEGKYDDSIKSLRKAKEKEEKIPFFSYNYLAGLCHYNKHECQLAYKCFRKCIRKEEQNNENKNVVAVAMDAFDVNVGKKYFKNNNTIADVCYKLAELCNSDIVQRDIVEQRRYYMGAMASDDFTISSKAQTEYDELTKEFLNSLKEKPFSDKYECHKRQFIYIAGNVEELHGYYDDEDSIQWLFTIDAFPKGLQFFPYGHPQPTSHLYYAHPVRRGLYYPFEKANDELFRDKVREFIRLAQCLGATEIKFRSVKGQFLSDKISEGLAIEVGGDYTDETGQYKGNAKYGYQSNRNGKETTKEKREIVQCFNPTKKPYIPDDLKKGWLSVDQAWQSLIKQRIEGDMLNFKVSISTRQTMDVSESTLEGVKGSFEALIANAHMQIDTQTDRAFKREEETEWEIDVTFKPIKELRDNSETVVDVELTSDEKQYLDQFRVYQNNDSKITPRERKVLDRIRQSLGISEERAMELEASLAKPQLTEDEQEYLEMFHEYVKKGEITAKERRKLEMSANAMGISQSRVQELEKL